MNPPTVGRRSSLKAIDGQIAVMSVALAIVIFGGPLLAYLDDKVGKGHIGTRGGPRVSADVISAEARNPGAGRPYDYAAHIVHQHLVLGVEHEAQSLVTVLGRDEAERMTEKA